MIVLFLGKHTVAEKVIYRLRRRQRENVLIAVQAVFNTERVDAALEHLASWQPIDRQPDHGTKPAWQSAPPLAITNPQMPLVTTKQLVGALADKSDFDILT